MTLTSRLSLTPGLLSGFLNFATRPLGGYLGDVMYRSYGTKGKKFMTLLCGLFMGVVCIAGGIYLQNNPGAPNAPQCKYCSYVISPKGPLLILTYYALLVPKVMGILCLAIIFSEVGNGSNFSLVPHCNAFNNVSPLCRTWTYNVI